MKFSDKGGTQFEQPPIGSHIARCIKLVDIGTQKGEYQGQANSRRQCIIGWELPNELMTEGEFKGKPFTVSKFYTQSLSEKATLRKDLVAWRGKEFTDEELRGFEAKNILGASCMVSLILNDKRKVVVSSVMAAPKDTKVPAQVNPLVFFSLDPESFDRKVYDGLSDGYKKMINVSPEFQQLSNPANQDAEHVGESFSAEANGMPFNDPYSKHSGMWRVL